MGLLNRMIGNLVADATGFDKRTVRRLVGGKKGLLMMGAGAALAGGFAAYESKNPSGGPSSWSNPNNPRPAAPPPPPPVPGQTPQAAPPPPPLPVASQTAPPPPPASIPEAAEATETTDSAQVETTESDIEDELPLALTYAIVRTMVAAALADGHLDDAEREMIHGHLGDSGLAEEQVQQIQRDLVLPPSAQDLAKLTDDDGWREAMYRFAGLVTLADGQVGDLERSWLDRLADALGFDAERKAALEAEIFDKE